MSELKGIQIGPTLEGKIGCRFLYKQLVEWEGNLCEEQVFLFDIPTARQVMMSLQEAILVLESHGRLQEHTGIGEHVQMRLTGGETTDDSTD